MLNEINIKKAGDILGNLKNKITGSNKSKANLSIIDKIRKYYLEKINLLLNDSLSKRVEEKEEIEESLEAYKDDLNEAIKIEANGTELKKIAKGIKEDEHDLKTNEKVTDFLKKTIASNEEKLSKIEEKEKTSNEVEIKPIEANSDEKEDSVSTDKLEVKEEMTPSVSDEIETKISEFISKYNAEMTNINKELIENIKAMYATKIDDLSNKYQNALKEQTEQDKAKIEQITLKCEQALVAASKDAEAKDNKIKELNNKNTLLTNDLENANKTITEKDSKINELNENVISLNSLIEANKMELDVKDKEIERLKVFEQKWELISQAMSPVDNNLTDATKTK